MVFLAEPFTRPKVMYRLAEIGLTQSYTCVTWRHTIGEITGHLMELNAVPAHEFARPNLFVNTPNSNPPYLQASDRPGCLIRVALACTPHGLWGMYSGFEICELEPLPGHEEYHDSEKYQMRLRDFSAPGNITAEIAGLNRICRVRPDDGALAATNLMHGHSFIWQDRSQRIRLDPAELPSAIWQVMPPRGFQ